MSAVSINCLHCLSLALLSTGKIIPGRWNAVLMIVAIAAPPTDLKNDGEKKLFWLQRFAMGNEMVRSLVNHRTVLVLALNRPAVGGGAAWFQGA